MKRSVILEVVLLFQAVAPMGFCKDCFVVSDSVATLSPSLLYSFSFQWGFGRTKWAWPFCFLAVISDWSRNSCNCFWPLPLSPLQALKLTTTSPAVPPSASWRPLVAVPTSPAWVRVPEPHSSLGDGGWDTWGHSETSFLPSFIFFL